MSAPDSFEDDLLHAMTRTGEGFSPQGPAGLAGGGLERGRRRWRRRSAAAVVGGAAALALVGTGAFYLTDGSPSAVRLTPAGTGPTPAAGSGTGSASLTPGSSPTASATPSAGPAVSGEEVLAMFRALLPQGQISNAEGAGADRNGQPNTGMSGASLVFDEGKGKSWMTISFSRVAQDDPSRTDNDCPDKKIIAFDACTATALPDGGRLTVFQGYEYPDRRVDTKWWNAKLTGKDGRRIELSEWNSPAEKGKPVSRATPPLTPEQLRAIVTDKSWDRVIAALPEPVSESPNHRSEPYTKEEILATAAKLLPTGLKQTETGGSEGYANFVVNDGKGKSMVELNVDDWSNPMNTEPFGGTETMPDGTQVKVRKVPGNPARWTVDALHPDGLRVAVGAYNSGGPNAAGSRTAPALTVEQMKAIATSPEWKLKKK
ncbi:hypothetical protein ABZW10_30230 [Kitasatospora sp. NPDC004723]|uniref:hypothetical protein n=1 Tax=Kitasatospora sp. NPDC004723 TaxID=3154288 RepID=UPI0033AF8B0F